MDLPRPLLSGRLLKRYKRFLADVELDDGRLVTAHTANTGAMTGCAEPGSRVWLYDSGNPQRKYPLSWEMVEGPPGVLIGINTQRANALVEEGVRSGVIRQLTGYDSLRREAKVETHTRFDLKLSHPARADCYVEVKNVTLVEEGRALFPDAVTSRGAKHLAVLAERVARGERGVLVFCVQRGDADSAAPADHIDPHYGQLLRQVVAQGVEVYAYEADVGQEAITLKRELPVTL